MRPTKPLAPVSDAVALYMRVSGDSQEKEDTIASQEYYLRQYCDQEGLSIARVYKDQACQNEMPFDERTDGARLFREAEQGFFGRVLLFRSCRWTRDGHLYKVGRERLEKLGVTLDSISERLSWDTPGNAFTSDIQLRANRFMRDVIEDNCAKGKYRRASEGGYVGGADRYGYIVVLDERARGRSRKAYAVYEPEAEVIRMMFLWCVEEGLSCARIATRLNEMGIPTPAMSEKWSNADHWARRKSRGLWGRANVSQILRRPVYTGTRTFGGKYQESVTQACPAIITEELFSRAQVAIDQNLAFSPRNSRRTYLFRGKLRCASCERNYVGTSCGQPNGIPIPRYRCVGSRRDEREAMRDRPRCPFPSLSATRWEADLWEKLTAHLLDQQGTLAKLQAAQGEQTDHSGILARQRDLLARQVGELEEEYRHALRGRNRFGVDLAADDARQVLADVKAEREEKQQTLAAVEQQLADTQGRSAQIRRAESHIERYARRLAQPLTDEEKLQIVGTFLKEARVEMDDSGEGRLTYFFYFDDEAAQKAEGVVTLAARSSCYHKCTLAVETQFGRR